MTNEKEVFDSFDEFDEARQAIREQAATRTAPIEQPAEIDTDIEQPAEETETPVEVVSEKEAKKNKKKK